MRLEVWALVQGLCKPQLQAVVGDLKNVRVVDAVQR